MSGPSLRPYQVQTREAIWAAYQAGTNRILIQSATGTGKTVMLASLPTYKPIAGWLEQFPSHERRILILAHREELLAQAADKIQRANPDLYVGIEQADSHAGPLCQVVIASVQTLAAMKYRRLDRLLKRGPFRIVVVDEAHHATASTYRGCLTRLGFLPSMLDGDDEEMDAATLATTLREWDVTAPRDRILLGVTATPNRSDAVGLGAVFQTIAFSYPIKQAIDDGWLAPITPWIVDTTTELDDVAIRRGEFDQRQLADAVNNPERNRLAVAAWKKYAPNRPTLAFTVDVQHAHDLAAAFTADGIWANAVSGETPKDHRRQLLADFGVKYPVLVNCMLLTEGTDLPRTSCILHAKPTKSATLYTQITGRGLRTHPGKTDCVVIDLVDIARRHSLQTAPVLYGLPPLKPEGKKLTELADQLERLREQYPNFNVQDVLEREGRLSIDELLVKAKAFDVWTVPALSTDERDGLALSWIKIGDGAFRIQYPFGDGTEVLKVEKDMLGHFDISCTLRPFSRTGDVRQRTIAAQIVGVNAALKLAESFVSLERSSVLKLKDKDAFWKKKPASDKQLALLRRRRIPYRQGLSAGEASSLIDMANARRGL